MSGALLVGAAVALEACQHPTFTKKGTFHHLLRCLKGKFPGSWAHFSLPCWEPAAAAPPCHSLATALSLRYTAVLHPLPAEISRGSFPLQLWRLIHLAYHPGFCAHSCRSSWLLLRVLLGAPGSAVQRICEASLSSIPSRLGQAAITVCSPTHSGAPPAGAGGPLHLPCSPGAASAPAGCNINCTEGEDAWQPRRLSLGFCLLLLPYLSLYILVKNCYSVFSYLHLKAP